MLTLLRSELLFYVEGKTHRTDSGFASCSSKRPSTLLCTAPCWASRRRAPPCLKATYGWVVARTTTAHILVCLIAKTIEKGWRSVMTKNNLDPLLSKSHAHLFSFQMHLAHSALIHKSRKKKTINGTWTISACELLPGTCKLIRYEGRHCWLLLQKALWWVGANWDYHIIMPETLPGLNNKMTLIIIIIIMVVIKTKKI